MKKCFLLVVCLLIITFSSICVYAGHSQEYADAFIGKIESIKQAEFYCDGYSYFTDINNDGTDEVILMHYEGLPYYISVNSYAPQYNLSENGICSVEAFCNVYSHSGDVCVGDISVYKYDNTLVIKDTTFIVGGLPNGDPSPTSTATYMKFKVGENGEIVFDSEAYWAYYEEGSQYYMRRGYHESSTAEPVSKNVVDNLIAEYEKGEHTLLYTVNFDTGNGVVYSANTLTFEETIAKLHSGIVQEVPEEPKPEETKFEEVNPPKTETENNAVEETSENADKMPYVILIVLLIVAILLVATILVIVLIKNKNQAAPKQ